MVRARGFRGTGTIVERGGRWYVRRSVLLPNGKRSRPRSRPYPSREAAIRASESSEVVVGSAPWTWGAIFDELLGELELTLKENGQDSYFDITERHIRLHLRPRLGRKIARETTSDDLKQLWRELLAVPLKPKYVTNIRGTLSLATQAALRWEVLDRNVVTLAKLPGRAGEVGRQRKTAVIPFKPEEAERLAQWLVDNWQKRSQNALALLCSLETGARRGEIFGIRWTDIDFERGTISFVEQAVRLKTGLVELTPLKTLESGRTISVSPLQLEQLRIHRAAVGGIGDRLVFCHKDGRPRNPDKLNDFVARHLPWDTEIGLVRRPQPHLLRHTHASLLILGKETIPNVSERLSHSVSTTTLNTYAHAVRASKDNTASLWDDLLGRAPNARDAE